MTHYVPIAIDATRTSGRSSRKVNRGEVSRAQKPPMGPRAVNKTPHYLGVSVDVHGQRGSSAGIVYGGEGWTRRVRPVRQPETGQRHAQETEAEFSQRRTTCDRFGHRFGWFIEFVIHSLSFISDFVFCSVGCMAHPGSCGVGAAPLTRPNKNLGLCTLVDSIP